MNMKSFKEVWESRVKEADVKNGLIVYRVFSPTGSYAHLVTGSQTVSREVYVSDFSSLSINPDLEDVKFFETASGGFIHSLLENNMVEGQSQKTFTALFVDKEDAQRYSKLIQVNDLPEDVKAVRAKLVAAAQAVRENNDNNW